MCASDGLMCGLCAIKLGLQDYCLRAVRGHCKTIGSVKYEKTRGLVNASTGGLVPVNTGESLSPVCFSVVTGVKPMSLWRLSVSAESLEETDPLGRTIGFGANWVDGLLDPNMMC